MLCTLALLFPVSVGAQVNGGMSITITPPLFQLSLQPGESWASMITVVNNNLYDLTLYAHPVLFQPSGESGKPAFLASTLGDGPLTTADDTNLAGWIRVPNGAFTLSREQTYSLPVSIHVPSDAAPGGHYAAVLIGNNAPESVAEEGVVNVTSSVAALFFLTVAGDVVEEGRVREFSTEKTMYETAEAHFTLRFENQGNVHLLPQGNIVIYNMFGKERGVIPVNHDGNYGNVLPGSVRNFSFSWRSDVGLWDIGRYKAEVTVGYGKSIKQNAFSATYFYVLPIVPLLEVLAGVVSLLFFVSWALKRYIHRALSLEAMRMNVPENTTAVSTNYQVPSHTRSVSVSRVRVGTLVEPIKEGFIDLRSVQQGYQQSEEKQGVYSTTSLIAKYKLFFIFIALLVVAWFSITVYFKDVMTEKRVFDATEVRPDGSHVPIQFE